MAGIPQEGLQYASIPSTFFDNDARIDRLLDAQGWRGVGVYLYLLLRAYGSHGYYIDWSYADCATTARKMGGGISAGQVEEAIRCCTQVGLYDKRLLEEWSVLSSVDIQQNYLAAAKKARRRVQLVSEYWLLAEKPPLSSLVSCVKNANERCKNADDCSKDEHKCSKDDPSMYEYEYGINTTTTTDMLDSKAETQSLLLSSEEIEERQKKYGDGIGQWERILARPLTPFELDDICQLVDEYGGQWVIDAMSIAGEAGRLSLRYVKGTLNNWKTDGREGQKARQKSEQSLETVRAGLLAGMQEV